MPHTSSPNRARNIALPKHLNIHLRTSTHFADRERELNRLRAVVTRETMISHIFMTEPEFFPDPTDQAAVEHELDVALSVNILALEKLRRIEQALTSIHAHSYGICSCCAQEIPEARLKVQPDSLFCVPCLTLVEQEAAGN
ncbi:MAG: TraR/DksA C4-type zinc finger protein [Nitrospirota bacterium]|nr:TraR/DksA C4-type zinc finger protein [Nitrospirota bacterium]